MTVPITEKDIKEYLSNCIIYWRAIQESQTNINRGIAVYYVDAFQSVYTSLFGESLE